MQKKSVLSFILVISIALGYAVNGNCQATISADTLKNMLIRDWERAKDYTGEYMKTMPADKYSFKATDSVRSFAQQLLHLAQTNMFFITISKGEKPDFSAPELEKSTSAQSADSVVYYVNKSYDAVISTLKNLKASELMKNETINMGQVYTASKLTWFMKAFEHQTHHRGQTTIYIRLQGIRPPQERLF